MGAAVIACSVRYGLTPDLYSEQELRPTETSRGDSENLFSESPRDREILEFFEVPCIMKNSLKIKMILFRSCTNSNFM